MTEQSMQTPANNHTENAMQPVPSWVKLGGAALLIIVTLFVLWMVFSGDEETDNKASLTSLEGPEAKPRDTPGASSLRERISAIKTPTESADAVQLYDQERISPTRRLGDIQPMKQQLLQLQQQLQQMDARFTRDQERQDGWVQAVQKLVDEMRGEIAAIKKSIQRPKPAVARKVKRHAKTVKFHKAMHAPFILVSVDRWGHDLYAVIRYQGRLHDLTVGQSLAGWSLESFNRRQDGIILKNAQGRTIKLAII